jgi:uncharacterized protein (TIGR00730 family)
MTSSGKSNERTPASAETGTVVLSLCVFCGARHGDGAASAAAAAREVGRLIGMRGHNLVYGAGASGLMGEVAWSAARNGSAVTGYAPYFIHEREAGDNAPRQTLYITKDLFDRKRRMIEHGDAFIALPGGLGTLDEVLEVLSLKNLEITNKPLILLNVGDFWGAFARLANSLFEAGFASPGEEDLFHVAATPLEAIDLAERLSRRVPGMTPALADRSSSPV